MSEVWVSTDNSEGHWVTQAPWGTTLNNPSDLSSCFFPKDLLWESTTKRARTVSYIHI